MVTLCQLRVQLYAVLVKLIKSATDVWMLRGHVVPVACSLVCCAGPADEVRDGCVDVTWSRCASCVFTCMLCWSS